MRNAADHVRNIKSVLKDLEGGATLCCQLSHDEALFWLEPYCRPVPRDVAEWVIIDPRVQENKDSLFGPSQTWRYVNAEISVQQGVAEANQGAPEGAGTAPA